MWKKKLREYKGKYSKYSLRNKLLRKGKINSNFEVTLLDKKDFSNEMLEKAERPELEESHEEGEGGVL